MTGRKGSTMAKRYGPHGMALSEIQDSCTDPLVLDLCKDIEQLEDRLEAEREGLRLFADEGLRPW